MLKEMVDGPANASSSPYSSSSSLIASRAAEEDSGIDTGDSSDEKRHQASSNQGQRVKRTSLLSNHV